MTNVLVPTIASSTGLLGGYYLARATGIRALGGVGLAAGGATAFKAWQDNRGTATAVALTAVYLGGFGYSHVLHKKIGAWPAVLSVTAASAAASLLFGGPKKL